MARVGMPNKNFPGGSEVVSLNDLCTEQSERMY